MRKLSNIDKNSGTSLETIKRSCGCAVICEVPGQIPSYHLQVRSEAVQRKWAFSGTMPQSVNKINV